MGANGDVVRRRLLGRDLRAFSAVDAAVRGCATAARRPQCSDGGYSTVATKAGAPADPMEATLEKLSAALGRTAHNGKRRCQRQETEDVALD